MLFFLHLFTTKTAEMGFNIMIRKIIADKSDVYLHWIMTIVGGFLGTYSILLHAGNFGSAQTGNLMQLSTELLSMNFSSTVYRLLALVFFGAAVAAAYILTNYTHLNMRRLAIIIDALGLITSSLLPLKPVFISLYPIFFCAAFQWGVYSAAGGFNSSSIFTTNNFKQSVLGWTQYALTKDKKFKKKAVIYSVTVLSFFMGACIGSWSVYTFDVHGAYIAFIPLVIAWIVITISETSVEDDTPEEIAVEAATKAQEALLLKKEQK